MSLTDQLWSPTSVQVTVLQARGLRIKGKSGTNDAYAVMQVGKEKYQTSVVEKSVAPMWKEEAAFDLMPAPHQGAGGTLHVHVLHRALVGPDKLLGQAVINLLQLSEDKTRNKTEWFKLLDKTGKPDKDRGEVLVDIQFLRNNMTASMFDLSGAGKSRSRLGKFKDKVKGKKKESDTSSNVVPSFTQVLTDSEEEGHGDGEVPAGKDEKKKKLKIKSLFSPKSNLQKNMSQSMSVLPGKNSPLSGSISSGLNVDASEGKKKFKFKIHKRTGSSDNKDSSAHQKHAAAEQSNVCINGSHVYCEEPPPRTSRIGSNYSLASSGHGSMEDVPDSSPPSVDSLRAVRQYSPWTEEEEEEEAAAVKPTKDEVGELRSREEERVEEERRKEEEERERLAEEKRRQEEENRRAEEEKAKWEEEERIRRAEEDRVRRHEEELKRLVEEKRRQEDEERRIEEEKMKKEEEERKRKEEEERKRQEEEERVRREEEHARLCEEKKKQEEQERQKIEERRKREEEEMIRLERERAQEERMKIEEEERARRLVEEQKLEEEERRVEEEERRRIKEEKARQEEEERIRREEERVEEDRRRQEEEEMMRRQEEEQKRRLEEQESEKRQREEEERIRKEEEEEEKVRKEEYERLVEEKRKQKEEEKKRIEAEEQKRRKEEEETRLEEERKKLQEMRELEEEEKRRLEEEEKRQREEAERISWEEERRKEEEERVKKEKEEYERQEELERRRVEEEERARKEEQERIEEERRRNEEEEEQVRKEMKRLAEEKMRLEEEERSRIEEEEKRQREEEERVRREMEEMERLAEEKRRREEEERSRIKEEEQKIMEKKKKKEEEARKLEKEKLEKEAEEQMKREIKRKHKAAGRKVDLEISAEVTSSNPFDENYSSNPFEEISSSPAEPDRCQSAASTNDKDLITSQRGKRAAPKPPGGTQAERQTQREQDGSASRHLAQINKQSKDKDARVLSLIPTRSVKKTAPVKGLATGTENAQSSKVNSAAKVTTSVTKPGKRVAPPRPGSGESEPKAAQAPERKTSKTEEEPIVYGLNPFEEDENELTAQDDTVIKSTSGSVQSPLPVSQPAEKDTASQTKVKSFKMAPAPPLPVTSTDTSSSSISQSTNGELVTGDLDRTTLDNNKTQDPKSKTISLVQVKEVSLQESQHATVQTAAEEAGEKNDAPPPAPRRLQPVKPLNPLEQQSIPVVDREKENKSAGILCEVQEKTRVNDTGIKGPYSQLTQQELISMVLKQENQLKERDKTISELEQYIDNLLVRVIEEAPTILNSLNCLKKAV